MDISRLQAENLQYKSENKSLKDQLDYTQKMLAAREEQLKALHQSRFKPSSEKHKGPDIFDFNEVEVNYDKAEQEQEIAQEVKAHTRKKSGKTKLIPDHLPRVDVFHPAETECDAFSEEMVELPPMIKEELACKPAVYYVVRNIFQRFVSKSKEQPPVEAKQPPRMLPKSKIHPLAAATWIEQKYDHGLPLYRLEKISKTAGVSVSRDVMSRTIIQVSEKYLQPLVNIMNDTHQAYDICFIDETTLQVLQEPGRSPQSKSYLWMRRGGKPGNESIILNYSSSRSTNTCKFIIEGFKGHLVSDAYPAYLKISKESSETEKIYNVLCSDHSRRRFKEAYEKLGKKSQKGSLSDQALMRYAKLYKLEKEFKDSSLIEKLSMRQSQAKPLWSEFIQWAENVYNAGIAHKATKEAFEYLLKFKDGLTAYLEDPRLPISNILAEHIAKHVAIARKNFLFSKTPSGAHASANCFSVIQTAKLHGHQPGQYLSVILSELPKAKGVDDFEKWLPWNVTPEEIKEFYSKLPLI